MAAAPMPTTAGPAAAAAGRVFNIAELLESILSNLSSRDLLSARFANRQLNHSIQGSRNIGIKLWTVATSGDPRFWDFDGLTPVVKPAPSSAVPGQYTTGDKRTYRHGGYNLQIYEPNPTLFTTSSVIPTPPPGYQPLHGIPALCYKISKLLDEEVVDFKTFGEAQMRQGHLVDNIGCMRWIPRRIPRTTLAQGVAVMNQAFITSPPCTKATVKWLIKIQPPPGKDKASFRLFLLSIANPNGLRVECIAAALEKKMRKLPAMTIIDWELQVVPEWGVFPSEQEKRLVV